MKNFATLRFVVVISAVIAFPISASHADEMPLIYEPFDYGADLQDGEAFRSVQIVAPGLIGSWRPATYAPESMVKFQSSSLNFGNSFPARGGSIRFLTNESVNTSAVEANMESEVFGEIWHSFLFKQEVVPEDWSSHVHSTISGYAFTAAKAGNTGIIQSNEVRPGVGYGVRPALNMASEETGAAVPADLPLEPGVVYLAVSRFTRIGEEISMDAPGKAQLWVFEEGTFSQMVKSLGAKAISVEDLDNSATWKASYERTSLDLAKVLESGFDRFVIASFRGQDSWIDEVRLGDSLRSVIPAVDGSK